MEYKLPSGEAAITDECSGGYSFTMSVPLKAKDRNKALHECLQELLTQQKEILSLRQEVEVLKSLKRLIILTGKDAEKSEGDYYQAGEELLNIAQGLYKKEQDHE